MIDFRLGASALGLFFLTPSLAAQTVAPDPAPEIVVTAQRRVEAASSVPIALSVLSGATLAERGVTGVNQLQYQTPGLEAVPAFGGGQPQFRLRGVGFDDYASNNASPVTIYVDEVAKPFPIQTQGLLFDLQRVEVLRGPQGTLYGRNTTGGAINIVTARPTDHLAAGVDADYGSFGLFRGEAFVSGPLAQGLTARIAAATEQGGGFQRNRADGRSLGDADRWGARGQLAYVAGPLDVLVEGHYGRDTSDGTGLYLFQPLGSQPADSSRRLTGWGGSTDFARVTGVATDARPFRDNHLLGGSARVALDLGAATLTGITAYDRFHRIEYNDWDATAQALAGTFFDSRARVFTQELRLSSNGTGALTWQGGAYLSDERLREAFVSDFPGYLALTSYRQHARTIAGFGQADYRIGALTLTGGVRVEHEKRDLLDFATTTVPLFGLGVAQVDRSTDYTKWSGKAAVSYQLRPRTLVYASVSRGIKSGGFTAYNTVSLDQLSAFRPERLTAWEAGFKSRFAGDRIRLNGAAFYYRYDDQQVQSAIYATVVAPSTGATLFDGPIGKIVNAPRAHIYGAEAELTVRPMPALEITQGLSWKRGTFDRFVDLDIDRSVAAGRAVLIDRAGSDEGFPRWSYNGSASYRIALGRFDLTPQLDYSYRDTLNPVLLGPLFRVHDYWLVNGTVTLASRTGWSIGVYGRNILGQRYDLTRNFFLGGIDIAAPGRPASFGVRGRATF